MDRAIGDLYERLDAEIARHRPVCRLSGRCCRFDAFGHRLYVTGLEIARFLERADTSRQAQAKPSPLPSDVALPLARPQSPVQDGCPYQVDGRCQVHAVRPLGCRIFFCQEGTEQWQQALYEKYLHQIKAHHERFAVPYVYMEWRNGLHEAKAHNPPMTR